MTAYVITADHALGKPKIRKHWAERRRATIGLAILAPFVILTLTSSAPQSAPIWIHLPIQASAWTLFIGGAALRFWATLYIGGRKGQTLVCDGPFSITRNPLYFGTFLMALGTVVFLHSLTLTIGLMLAASAYLGVTISAEEKRLRSKLGEPYREYCERVPRFWPRVHLLHAPPTIEVDLRCLAIETLRAMRWAWLPVIAELLLRARAESWWPHWFCLP